MTDTRTRWLLRNKEQFITLTSTHCRSANLYNLFLFLVQFIPAGLLSIFISPFADIYGLKVPVMIATAGGCLQVGLLLLLWRGFQNKFNQNFKKIISLISISMKYYV